MARLLEQPSAQSLASWAAYSPSFSSASSRSNSARVSSFSYRAGGAPPSKSSLTWGRRKQAKRTNKAESLPLPLKVERGFPSGNGKGVSVTSFRENLTTFYEQTGFCREDALLGQRGNNHDNGRAPAETLESGRGRGGNVESNSNGRATSAETPESGRGSGGNVESDSNGRATSAETLETIRRAADGSCNGRAAEIQVPIREPTRVTSSPAFIQQDDPVWLQMREEARIDSESEPTLASYLYSTILAHRSLERALAFHLGNKLSSATFLSTQLVSVFIDTIMESPSIRDSIRKDIIAVRERDPACVSYAHCLLNFKGFLALQAHRVAHMLWTQGRRSLALAMQSRVSEVFHVDIHPGAVIGSGILFDHATGVVVGETAVIGNNVSILHHVTLGGTGSTVGDRHPKIGDGVLIGAGATILGPVRVGEGAKIGSCSLVLTDIPPRTTAVGNPARLVGGKDAPKKSKETPSETMDHTSFMSNWSDYVI